VRCAWFGYWSSASDLTIRKDSTLDDWKMARWNDGLIGHSYLQLLSLTQGLALFGVVCFVMANYLMPRFLNAVTGAFSP
jgi:hypothetical protein